MAQKTKDLRYWQERGGQIEWRLELARSEVSRIERDLAEFDDNIKRLTQSPAAR